MIDRRMAWGVGCWLVGLATGMTWNGDVSSYVSGLFLGLGMGLVLWYMAPHWAE